MEITATNPTSAITLDRIPLQTLGQSDFLKLLVTQMTTQDPLNPQKDTEFIAQMAQFSALEQAKTMQLEMARLRSDQELVRANSLLGKVVELEVSPDLTAQGAVSAVQIEAGTPKLIVGGEKFDLSQVRTIAPNAAGGSTSTLNNYA